VDRPVELVPLVCLKCSTRIPAEPDEVAWVCTQCGRGMLLFEKHGLVELGVDYSAALTPNATGRPFWVADCQVKVQSRQTYSGNQEREAQDFWSQPRRVFIPAFTCSLEDFLSLGMHALLQPPTLQPGPPASSCRNHSRRRHLGAGRDLS
jgi:hypothetical protein